MCCEVVYGREWDGDVDVFFGIYDVDLQLGSNRSNVYVVATVLYIHKRGIRIAAKFRGNDLDEGQEFGGVLAGLAKVMLGDKMHGHGNGSRG